MNINDLLNYLKTVKANLSELQLEPQKSNLIGQNNEYRNEYYNTTKNSGYIYKQKYNPLSLQELYNYMDIFIEDYFYYNQFYYPYFKLILHHSDFNFEIYTQSDKHFETIFDGQVFVKFEKFPIVHVNEFNYNYTQYSDENLPLTNRSIKFQVLGKVMIPKEGDVVHIHGYAWLITKVEHDLRYDLFLCTQTDVWTIEEFFDNHQKGCFKIYDKIDDIVITKTQQGQFDFKQQNKRSVFTETKTIRIEKIKNKENKYNLDDVQLTFLE